MIAHPSTHGDHRVDCSTAASLQTSIIDEVLTLVKLHAFIVVLAGRSWGSIGTRVGCGGPCAMASGMLIHLCLVSLATAVMEVPIIPDDQTFEAEVIHASSCIAVLFTSETRETPESLLDDIHAEMPGLLLAKADVDSVKAFSSEFNVRKRMVPRLLLFNARARQAHVIKLKDDGGGAVMASSVVSSLRSLLAENEQTADGQWQKLTLAIGGGGGDKSEL